MKLEFDKPALKGLRKMPAKDRMSLLAKLDAIAAGPFVKHPFDVKAMKGMKDVFRVRQGDWRAVYEVIRVGDTVLVLIIDIRGEVYE